MDRSWVRNVPRLAYAYVAATGLVLERLPINCCLALRLAHGLVLRRDGEERAVDLLLDEVALGLLVGLVDLWLNILSILSDFVK